MIHPTRLGKYEIQGVLGKGAMGVVYKGYDPNIERVVAIKTVRKDLVDEEIAAEYMSRFKNEARAAGRLHHPNIVGIYEYGEDDDVAFIAMEFVDGAGLREYLNRNARFELGQLVGIMSQLLRALDFAHGKGVVHRDIKPANLILTTRGELKVADFGIARIDLSNLTMAGTVIGTPSYMSPEQCQGKQGDHRSDLFSAGVVLYELLTGEKPFAGSLETIAYKICHDEPRAPSQISALSLPPEIDALLATALAKSPDARFQNASTFHQALQKAAGPAAADAADETVLNLAGVVLPPPIPAAWDDATLIALGKQLARFVGPMAKVLVRQAAAQTTNVDEMYAILATNIVDPKNRHRFVAEPHATGTGLASAPAGGHSRATDGRTTSASQDRSGASTSHTRLPPRPLDQAFVDETTMRLAVYLGPIARIVTKKAAQQAKDPEEFVQIVASHIGTQDRHAFLREIGFDEP
jgi:serine/threonine-protein kinase